MKRQWFYEFELEEGLIPPARIEVPGSLQVKVLYTEGQIAHEEVVDVKLYRYGNRLDDEATAAIVGEKVGGRLIEAVQGLAEEFVRRISLT